MFDNEEFDNCNNEYQDEWAARDRAGGVAHPLLQGTNMGGEMGKLQSKLYKINISDEEKFAGDLQRIFLHYMDIFGNEYQELIDMLDYITNEEIMDVEYKDPLCFLLGYNIMKKMRGVKNNKYDNCVNKLHKKSKIKCVNCKEMLVCQDCMREDRENHYIITETGINNLCINCVVKLNVEKFNEIYEEEYSRVVKENGISKIDLIRYCRMWMMVLKKK